MHVFEVWAPLARTVEVKIGDQKFALAPRDRGWWSAGVESAGPGTDYGFVLDGPERLTLFCGYICGVHFGVACWNAGMRMKRD